MLLPYGDKWRNQRKLITHDFSQGMVPRYYPLQEKEARLLVKNILNDAASLTPQLQLYGFVTCSLSRILTVPEAHRYNYCTGGLWLLPGK